VIAPEVKRIVRHTACFVCPNCGEDVIPAAGEILKMGRLTLNTDTHEVFVDGELRGIGQYHYKDGHRSQYQGRGKPFMLLERMVRQPGRVFTRDNVLTLTNSWGDPHFAEVLISGLRVGLRDVVNIVTHYGVGWSLSLDGNA
jgi:DNA-binding response OmpR family regulator